MDPLPKVQQQTWATTQKLKTMPASSDPRAFDPSSSSPYASERNAESEVAAQRGNISQEGGYASSAFTSSTSSRHLQTPPEKTRQQMKDIFSPSGAAAPIDNYRSSGGESNDSSPQGATGLSSSSAQQHEQTEEFSDAVEFLTPQRSTIGTSAAASNSNEDFFFSRDPLLLPRRNHTIGAGSTPNRKRIDSHFMFPSQGPTSPGQNSLSAITGGKDVDDDEWEAMIKSRRSLVPGEDDREDMSHYNNNDKTNEPLPWQRNTALANAQHKRFPSQPSSVRAVSPFLSGSHSPLNSRQATRGGGGGDLHKRSESASIRSLEQGPFASASSYFPSSSDGLFANLDPSMIRRHQSLNHATGRAMANRLQGSTRRNLYADRPHDSERTSPVASLAFDASSSRVSPGPGPGYDRGEIPNAGHLSPEAAIGSSPAHSPSSTLLSTSLLDAHARLSRMTIQPSHKESNDAADLSNAGRGQQLHSLITNRDVLERASLYSSPGKRDASGPASAAAFVPPIGHAHFRQHDSSSSYASSSTATESDLHTRSDPVRAPSSLQGPFSALPSTMPWSHQGPSTVGKPSTMVSSQLETAREESPMLDNNGFDASHNRSVGATGSDRSGKQASLDSMAMNIAILQQRLLSQQQSQPQQQQHHLPPHRQPPQSGPHMVQQQQPYQQPPPHHMNMQQQHPAMLYGANQQHGMMDMRHSPYMASYNPLLLDNSGLRAHQPQFSPNNSLQPNARPPPHLHYASNAYTMPHGAAQPSMPAPTPISPALAALIAEKGYNPSPAQFDITAPRARFFVIKSFTEDDVQRSLKHEIWASTEKGNQRLDRAFKECEAENTPLYLFYSVNASGHFCGMAQMMSALDYNSTSNVWVQEGKWKGTFRVKWIFVKDVPNVKLRHIKLTNTVERKAITQSRDTQELPTEGGREVLRIMAEYQMKTTLLQDWLFYEQSAASMQQQQEQQQQQQQQQRNDS